MPSASPAMSIASERVSPSVTQPSSTTLSQTEVSKLPMRQLTFSIDDDRSFFFSKLPMRQLTGVVCAIILILIDLHQFPLIEPQI